MQEDLLRVLIFAKLQSKEFSPSTCTELPKFLRFKKQFAFKKPQKKTKEKTVWVFTRSSRHVTNILHLTRVRLSDTLKGEELSTLFSLKAQRLPGGGI